MQICRCITSAAFLRRTLRRRSREKPALENNRLLALENNPPSDVTGGEKGWSFIRRKASLLKSSFLESQMNWLYDCLFSFFSLARQFLRSVMVSARIASKVWTSSNSRDKPWETHHAANEGIYPGLRRILAFIYLFLGFEVQRTWSRFSVQQFASVGVFGSVEVSTYIKQKIRFPLLGHASCFDPTYVDSEGNELEGQS